MFHHALMLEVSVRIFMQFLLFGFNDRKNFHYRQNMFIFVLFFWYGNEYIRNDTE